MSTCSACCYWKQASKLCHDTRVPAFGVCDRVGWWDGKYPHNMKNDLFVLEADAADDHNLSAHLRTKADFGCNQFEAVK